MHVQDSVLHVQSKQSKLMKLTISDLILYDLIF